MTTTAASLIERVRDFFGDYGDVVTTLSTAIATTSEATIYVASSKGIEPMDTILIGSETMEVTAVRTGYPDELDVIRGARGSTAATQTIASVVRARCRVTSKRILDALNTAVDAAYPKLYVPVTDDTLVVADDVYTYDIPTSGTPAVAVMDRVWRVEIENADLTSYFFPIRHWDMTDYNTIRIYGAYTAGRNIRLVGTKRFTPMTATGNLDSNYPEKDSALSYLIYAAAAELLVDVQVKLAKLDSFVGQTDAFTSGQPYVPGNIANQLREQARTYLEDCKMTEPQYFAPAPGRAYLARH